MSELKYKVGDKVRIQSLEWHQKEIESEKWCPNIFDVYWCSREMTISKIVKSQYLMEEDGQEFSWTDEMIECLVERNGKTYPYKIGDRVVLKGTNRCATITDLEYNSWGNLSYYIKIDNDKDISIDYPTDLLLPYNNMVEEIVEEETKPKMVNINDVSKSNVIAWCEKQCKETSWKPSKEEMDVLYGLAYITNQYDEHKEEIIIRLYQDLKREFFNGSSYENMFPDTEDDVRRRSTIQVLEYAKSLDNYNQYGKEDIDKNIAWLESNAKKPQGKSALELKNEKNIDNQNFIKPTDKVEPKFKIDDIVFVKNVGWVRITNSYWDSLANEYIYEAIGFNGEGEYDSINQSNIECQMLPESENPYARGNKITIDEYKNNDKEWLFNKLATLDNITALESIQDIFNYLQQSK